MAWGTFQGLTNAGVRKLLIINLDAHFDLRHDSQANSGTPFCQMQQWCTSHDTRFDYRVFGISRFANTGALFERAKVFGVRYWSDEDLQSEADLHAARQALDRDLAASEAVYLTVCLDVLPSATAPGVSAPATLGVPLSLVERLIDHIMQSGRVVAADLAEMNPAVDCDGVTARVAARLTARIARAWSAKVATD